MKARHRPQRTCVACRETMDQRELIRVALGDAGLVVDEARRAPGRGAYLCRRPACWQRARETSLARGGGALGHALRATLDDRDRSTLAAYEQQLATSAAAATHDHAVATAAPAAGTASQHERDEGESGAA